MFSADWDPLIRIPKDYTMPNIQNKSFIVAAHPGLFSSFLSDLFESLELQSEIKKLEPSKVKSQKVLEKI